MIGERLADIRKDHGHTQLDLAEYLGISVPAVRTWEQDKSSPSHEMLVSICRLYHVSADYLLGLTDVDPAYVQRQRREQFTSEELSELRQYEEFLRWRRKHNQK